MNRIWSVVIVVMVLAIILAFLMVGRCNKKEKETETESLQKKAGMNPQETDMDLSGVFTHPAGMKFVYIEPGSFMMGSTASENGETNEWPQHKVIITKGFYLQTTVLTQKQWKAVMGTEPWKDKSFVREGPDYPAVYTTWNDAQKFIEKLNKNRSTRRYRLPTEAEWEYACRAGSSTAYYWGDEIDGSYVWYADYSWDKDEKYADRVGNRLPNDWGLYDMSGNVWEWCLDWYGEDYYKNSPEKDPKGPESGEYRVLRGGSWHNRAKECRSAIRVRDKPDFTGNSDGFRLLRETD